jgi:general stress protein 26
MSTQDRIGQDAIEKIATMAHNIQVCMMATDLTTKPLSAIPMTASRVTDDGKVYFLSRSDSDHNADIQKDSDVQLLFSKPSDHEFLSLYGSAKISQEKALLENLYSSVSDNYFDGVDDPKLTAIIVEPKEAYYWDSQTNKYVTLFKMAKGAITGNQQDIGQKGKLDV